MIWGYARVSTQFRNEEYGKNQEFTRQELILTENGVARENIIEERISGGVSTSKREQWEILMTKVQKGDTIIVAEMSRLARSLQDLIETVNMLIKKKVCIKFIKENINVGNDGMDAMNKLMFNMFGAFAEFEKQIISDRTKQGLRAKKAQGVVLGRPVERPLTSEFEQDYRAGYSYIELCEKYNMAKGTVARLVKEIKAKDKVE